MSWIQVVVMIGAVWFIAFGLGLSLTARIDALIKAIGELKDSVSLLTHDIEGATLEITSSIDALGPGEPEET